MSVMAVADRDRRRTSVDDPVEAERVFAALDARAREWAGVMAAATSTLVEIIAEVEARALWGQFGFRSLEQWVSLRCGVSFGHAKRLISVARSLDGLPMLRERFAAGAVSEDQMVEVARAGVTAVHDREAAEFASVMSVPQLRRALSCRPAASDPESPPPEASDEHADPSTEPEAPSASVPAGDTSAGGVRVVSARLRTVVEHRDGGCVVPGCGRRSGLRIHHIRHWIDGGPTETWNLCALCSRDHAAVHRGDLVIGGNPDVGTLTVTGRDGRPFRVGAPTPPTGERLQAAKEQASGSPWRAGERVQWHWVTWADPRPRPTRPPLPTALSTPWTPSTFPGFGFHHLTTEWTPGRRRRRRGGDDDDDDITYG